MVFVDVQLKVDPTTRRAQDAKLQLVNNELNRMMRFCSVHVVLTV